MDRVLSVDPERLLAWVQPGLVNLWLSQRVAPLGLYFAPDPASQQVSTLGGNVSTNAGGPHCLKYGVTFNHVLGITAVLSDGAVMLIEIDGPAVSLPAQGTQIESLAKQHGTRSVRVAKDEAERLAIWRGRKSAFGAYGRTASGFYIMDGVVPRTRLAEALAQVYALCAERGLEAGNVFHAGDGNLHPHVLFDAGDPAAQDRALDASHEILRMCIRFGGTISGEHGVGIEKRPMMRELSAPEDLAVMEWLRAAFAP